MSQENWTEYLHGAVVDPNRYDTKKAAAFICKNWGLIRHEEDVSGDDRPTSGLRSDIEALLGKCVDRRSGIVRLLDYVTAADMSSGVLPVCISTADDVVAFGVSPLAVPLYQWDALMMDKRVDCLGLVRQKDTVEAITREYLRLVFPDEYVASLKMTDLELPNWN